jgi:hypothetical protein
MHDKDRKTQEIFLLIDKLEQDAGNLHTSFLVFEDA